MSKVGLQHCDSYKKEMGLYDRINESEENMNKLIVNLERQQRKLKNLNKEYRKSTKSNDMYSSQTLIRNLTQLNESVEELSTTVELKKEEFENIKQEDIFAANEKLFNMTADYHSKAVMIQFAKRDVINKFFNKNQSVKNCEKSSAESRDIIQQLHEDMRPELRYSIDERLSMLSFTSSRTNSTNTSYADQNDSDYSWGSFTDSDDDVYNDLDHFVHSENVVKDSEPFYEVIEEDTTHFHSAAEHVIPSLHIESSSIVSDGLSIEHMELNCISQEEQDITKDLQEVAQKLQQIPVLNNESPDGKNSLNVVNSRDSSSLSLRTSKLVRRGGTRTPKKRSCVRVKTYPQNEKSHMNQTSSETTVEKSSTNTSSHEVEDTYSVDRSSLDIPIPIPTIKVNNENIYDEII